MNLTFGLSDFGRMQILLKMEAVLRREKVIEHSILAYPEMKYEFMEEQLTINGTRRDLIRQMQEYDS